MTQKAKTSDEASTTELLGGIVEDAQTLIEQHFDLFRHEVLQEIRQVKSSVVALGAGTGLLALGGILSTHMLVHLLHRSSRLPLWMCYGLVGGACGAAGMALVAQARQQAAGVHLGLPPETVKTLKEDVQWLEGKTLQHK